MKAACRRHSPALHGGLQPDPAHQPIRPSMGVVERHYQFRDRAVTAPACSSCVSVRTEGGLAGALSCQLAWMLHDPLDDKVAAQVAKGAFAGRRLELFPAYSVTLRDWSEVRVERLDFTDERSVHRINAWVSEATGGAIPHLVSKLDPDIAPVLANAMRFEGEWARRFDPGRTVPAPFPPLRRGPGGPHHARGPPAGPVPGGRGLPGRRPPLRRRTLRVRGRAAARWARSVR